MVSKNEMPIASSVTEGYEEFYKEHPNITKILWDIRPEFLHFHKISELIKNKVSLPIVAQNARLEVLDVGSGIGSKQWMIIKLIEELFPGTKFKLTGIDGSRAAIDKAIARNTNSNVTYKVQNFLTLDSSVEGKKDLIFLIAVWHHIADIEKALVLLEDLLAPGGVAVIMDNFYPANPIGKQVAQIAMWVYKAVTWRSGMYYNGDMTIASLQEALQQCKTLQSKGKICINPLFNTHLVVMQKNK